MLGIAARAAAAGGVYVAGLDHEALDNAMEGEAVVIAALHHGALFIESRFRTSGEGHEVFHGIGRFVFVKAGDDRTHAGVEDRVEARLGGQFRGRGGRGLLGKTGKAGDETDRN